MIIINFPFSAYLTDDGLGLTVLPHDAESFSDPLLNVGYYHRVFKVHKERVPRMSIRCSYDVFIVYKNA